MRYQDSNALRPAQAVSAFVLSFAGALGACATAAKPDTASTIGAATRAPVIAKVDHFFATSPDAQALFLFFRDSLGIAQAWPFKSYGDFSSGAVQLGNVAFEFVAEPAAEGQVPPTEFAYLAFEPVGHTDVMLPELERRAIAHDAPEENLLKDASGQPFGWINTGLSGVSVNVAFVCDYSNREVSAKSSRAASEELARQQGGPLGVRSLEEIVIGAPDLEAARREWRKLLDSPKAESADVFTFGTGPRIRLVQSDTAKILRIVLSVRSLKAAGWFLGGKGWLEMNSAEVSIAKSATKGLHIVLVESGP